MATTLVRPTIVASPASPAPRVTGASGPALVLVGLLFLALQLALRPSPFGVSTDEATYLAMTDPAVPELYWTQPRAWGMPLLAAPVALASAGLSATRTYFAVLATVLLVATFWPWRRILHPAVAPVAALLFSTTWVTVYFGALVMPNLYVALAAVGAIGMFVRSAQQPRWWRSALVVGAAALLALVRPTDSVLILGPVFLLALLVRRLRRPGPLAAVAVGVALGWLPWVLEAYARFRGPVERMRDAESAGPRGLAPDLANLLILPRLLDGEPLYCCQDGPVTEAGAVPTALTGWVLVLPVLALVGLAVAARQRRLPEATMVAVPAVTVAAFYLLLPSFVTLRFLLPALALLCLLAAAALVGLTSGHRRTPRVLGTLVTVATLLAHAALMLPQAARVMEDHAENRSRQIRLAATLEPLIAGRPCLLVGGELQAASYYLGCQVQAARDTARPPRRVSDAQAHGAVVLALLRSRPDAGYLTSWERTKIPGLPKGYRAYAPSR